MQTTLKVINGDKLCQLQNDLTYCTHGDNGHDSCFGDSGTPIMYLSGNNRWYVYGVLSYGDDDHCYRMQATYYTSVPKYLTFLERALTAPADTTTAGGGATIA